MNEHPGDLGSDIDEILKNNTRLVVNLGSLQLLFCDNREPPGASI
jgi:hypothetical protein